MRDESDRPFRWLRWLSRCGQFTQRLKNLPKLIARIAAKGVVRHGQRKALEKALGSEGIGVKSFNIRFQPISPLQNTTTTDFTRYTISSCLRTFPVT